MTDTSEQATVHEVIKNIRLSKTEHCHLLSVILVYTGSTVSLNLCKEYLNVVTRKTLVFFQTNRPDPNRHSLGCHLIVGSSAADTENSNDNLFHVF